MAKKKAKKATKKKTAKKKAASKEVLVVASKCKAYVKSKGYMCSADAVQALSERVYEMLDEGMARTEANRRSTLKAQDL